MAPIFREPKNRRQILKGENIPKIAFLFTNSPAKIHKMSAVSFSRICPLTALCCLLLLINLSHRTVDANENEQSKPISKKSLSSWIQSYKEPKTNGQKNEEKEGGEGQQKQQEEEKEAEEEEMTCTIKVQKVEKHTGKCVRLRGGSMACQTSAYLDPVNADCMFLEE